MISKKRHQTIQRARVKKRDLERELKKQGWWFKRHGGNHDIWTNGEVEEAVPRHRDINDILAKSILKMVGKINKGKNR